MHAPQADNDIRVGWGGDTEGGLRCRAEGQKKKNKETTGSADAQRMGVANLHACS